MIPRSEARGIAGVAKRAMRLSHKHVPEGTKYLTAAVDLGKYLLHWIVVAWGENATGHVVEYGRTEVASDDLGVEQAIMIALKELRDQFLAGWPMKGTTQPKIPDQVWIDAGYMTEVVYSFCRQSNTSFRAVVGRGAAQQHRQWYNRPTQTGSIVKHIGEGFHFNLIPTEKLHLGEIDADHWKTWVHQRLSTPVGQPGAMTLFQASPQEHLSLAKHLTAERKMEEFIAGRGIVVKWERLRRQNHWFDALYNACAAGYYAGVRLVSEPPRQRKPRVTLKELRAISRGW